jgi:hydroxyquinol 1,2-dioxygenase
MAKRAFTDKDITARALKSVSKTRDPRLKQVMTSFIKHMHGFVRDVKPTPEEWLAGIKFLTETGHWSTGMRQEFILLSDTQGVSVLMDYFNYKAGTGTTESTVLGPFHREAAPEFKLGDNLCKPGTAGEPCVVRGSVKDAAGKPVANAKLDIWQGDAEGLYDSQRGEEMNLRGILHTDAKGEFWFRCVKPTAYPVPHDGPAGRLLKATGRHPMRPPHLHFWVTARGFKPLVTHIFVKGGKYLDSDAVFGVKPSLIVDFKKGKDGVYNARFDIVLMKAAKKK